MTSAFYHGRSALNQAIQILLIFSSPEPLGSHGELIVYPSSQRHYIVPYPFSKTFLSETTLPVKVKFYVEPPWEGEN